jgi:hypothetical protein
MPLIHLGLTTLTQNLSFSDLAQVAGAIQKQIARDFQPIWNIEGTLDAFAKVEDVPIGYWPLIVQDAIGVPVPGVHRDPQGQPLALIRYEDGWETATSHEALEMLADPTCNRLIAGDSIEESQGRVEYLVEVCDPCGAPKYTYTVNGVSVSNFCTPQYFDPVASSGVRYDYLSAVSEPRQVLRGGYLSWRVPETGDWWTKQWFDPNPEFVNLGPIDPVAGACLRAAIDRLTARAGGNRLKISRASIRKSATYRKKIAQATSARAASWRRMLDQLAANPQNA